MTTTTLPKAVILYVRQSDARYDDDRGGIDYHIKLLKEEAARRRWGVLRVIVENDVPDGHGGTRRMRSASAFKRRKMWLTDGTYVMRVHRPGFQQALALMKSGQADGLLAVELDRAMRDPRDLEDLIDVVESRKLNVGSYEESLEFTDGGTDKEIDRARDEVNRANRESRVKQKRARRGRERDMCKVKGHGGNRAYGWTKDYEGIIPFERDIVEGASIRVMHDISLAAIADELREAQVPTVTGTAWTPETVRDILTRPRNGGLVQHQGKIIDGVVWEGEPLVSVELFMAVYGKLTDESRRTTQPGAHAPKYQGSGIYECGICQDGTTMKVGIGKPKPYKRQDGTVTPPKAGKRSPSYVCKGLCSHLRRNVVGTDRVVDEWVIERMTQPDALWMFAPTQPDVDVPGLRAERAAIEANLNTMAADVTLGRIKRARLLASEAAARPRIEEIDRILADTVNGGSLVADLVTADDVRATWLSYPVATRRAIIRSIATVTILPIGRRTNGFDPTSIDIQPKVWESVLEVAA